MINCDLCGHLDSEVCVLESFHCVNGKMAEFLHLFLSLYSLSLPLLLSQLKHLSWTFLTDEGL